MIDTNTKMEVKMTNLNISLNSRLGVVVDKSNATKSSCPSMPQTYAEYRKGLAQSSSKNLGTPFVPSFLKEIVKKVK